MKIGTASPSVKEQAGVPHFLLGHVSIAENYSAGEFARQARKVLDDVFKTKTTALLVGGSGLYIKALCEGLDEFKPVNQKLRDDLQTLFKSDGIAALQDKLKRLNIDKFNRIDQKNPQRLMRAIEIELEGTTSQIKSVEKLPFRFLYVGLQLERHVLRVRIDKRVEQMLEEGLLEEVKNLLPYQHLNALQTVGYRECFDFLQDKISYAEMAAQIKTHTAQYAKRQMTWFKKDELFHWFDPSNPDVANQIVQLITH
jgi:tRNA dimethylallyltransferase